MSGVKSRAGRVSSKKKAAKMRETKMSLVMRLAHAVATLSAAAFLGSCGVAGAPEKPADSHPNADVDTRPKGGEF